MCCLDGLSATRSRRLPFRGGGSGRHPNSPRSPAARDQWSRRNARLVASVDASTRPATRITTERDASPTGRHSPRNSPQLSDTGRDATLSTPTGGDATRLGRDMTDSTLVFRAVARWPVEASRCRIRATTLAAPARLALSSAPSSALLGLGDADATGRSTRTLRAQPTLRLRNSICGTFDTRRDNRACLGPDTTRSTLIRTPGSEHSFPSCSANETY